MAETAFSRKTTGMSSGLTLHKTRQSVPIKLRQSECGPKGATRLKPLMSQGLFYRNADSIIKAGNCSTNEEAENFTFFPVVSK